MIAAIPFRTFPSFSVGPLTVRTFGVFVAIGIVLGVWLFLRYARERGLDPDLLSRLAWQVIVLGIIGSRALFVITNWSEFEDDPLSVFAIWQGGLQFSGSFLISIVVIWWFARRHPEMPGFAVTDGIVYGLTAGLVVGRLGCAAVGEHLGTETGFVLGWRYLGGETREPVAGGVGSVIHSTAVYEIFLLLPLAALLWWMQRRRVPDGWLTATFLLWYGTQRFLTDFLRAYDETLAGLTGAQFLSLGMIAGGLVLAVRLRRGSRDAPARATEAGAPAT